LEKARMARVGVLGSVQLDVVYSLPPGRSLPEPGETVPALSHAFLPGGKGANQAISAAISGDTSNSIAFAGCVGTDAFASESALSGLRSTNVQLDALDFSNSAPTGLASITVDANGQNAIVVSPGANAYIDARAQLPLLKLDRDDLLVTQLEVPAEQTEEALRAAKLTQGCRTMLNAAPAPSTELPVLREGVLDYLLLNESEAAMIADVHGLKRNLGSEDYALELAQTFGCTTVISLGASGALVASGTMRRVKNREHMRASVPVLPYDRTIVDTTGAGDAFVGAFAASVAAGNPLGSSVQQAVAAGTLACCVSGAQSPPKTSEVQELESYVGVYYI
jgi:ribokinase